MEMEEQDRAPRVMSDLHLCPDQRICPLFDSVGIAEFSVAARGKMGMRVLDNCCEEHIM